MSESYPIIQVRPEWAPAPESMGTKEKFWFHDSDDGVKWLFKHPRENTGEHWAEKIAADVAEVLGVPHAAVELAEFEGQRGSASRSFAIDGYELWHGNQIMDWTIEGYDPLIRYGQSDHSFENIWTSFERVFRGQTAANEARTTFAGYLVLDALIGNTDRHHENWAILGHRVEGRWRGRLAPSFDHASSLGRELLDDRRTLLLQEKRVGWYSERGRGGIYWGRHPRTADSPIDLARRAVTLHPAYFEGALVRLAALRQGQVTEIVNRVPSDWMSPQPRAFAVDLILRNRRRLMELGK